MAKTPVGYPEGGKKYKAPLIMLDKTLELIL